MFWHYNINYPSGNVPHEGPVNPNPNLTMPQPQFYYRLPVTQIHQYPKPIMRERDTILLRKNYIEKIKYRLQRYDP